MSADTHPQGAAGNGPRDTTPTLADAIQEGPSRREALRLSLRLSQAVAAMHARGEVHGGLTPGAIRLASSGEVNIAREEVAEPVHIQLRYVAPEVARRETPEKSADVFALSLIIRELIEGMPARRGTGDDLALDAVDGRVSAPHGLTGELQRLAALSASPHADTRPTASEFVAALRGETQMRGLTKQEWVVLAVAAVAVAMLFFLLRASHEERDRSSRQYEDARAAFDGLLAGIYPELDRVKDIDQLAEAGARALSSMELMEPSEREAEDEILYARMLLWNAEARHVQERHEEAKDLFTRAVAQAQSLGDRSIGLALELESETSLGEIARDERDNQAAKEHFRRAIALGEEGAEAFEGSAGRKLRIAHARALVRFGDLSMATGIESAERATQWFIRARRALEDPALGDTSQDREVIELFADLNKLESNAAYRRGDTGRAIELLRRHVEQAKRLIEMDPGRPRRRWLLARGANVLARTQRDAGQLEDAVESLRESVEAWRLLRAMEPEVVNWRREWARTVRLLAEALDRVGEWQEAAALHDISLGELEVMLADGILPATGSFEVGVQYLDAAQGLLAAGDLKRSRRRLDRAIERIGTETPTARFETIWFPTFARAKVVEAELMLAEGRWKAAEDRAYTFIEEVQALDRDGKGAPLREGQVRALLVTSTVRAMNGETDVAQSARERALAITDELLKAAPGDPEALALRARTLFVLGRDEEAAAVLDSLEAVGYRGLELGAVRAATAALRR